MFALAGPAEPPPPPPLPPPPPSVEPIINIIRLLCDILELLTAYTTVPRAPYFSIPLYDVLQLYRKPGLFKCMVRYDPEIFVSHILTPLFPKLNYPRGYHMLVDDIDIDAIDGSSFKQRRCQVTSAQRVFRFLLILRGIPPTMVAWLTDQHYTTIYRDFHHIAQLIMQQLGKVHLTHPPPNSVAYNNLRGSFPDFPNAIYAADVTKIKIRRYVELNH